MHNGGTLSRPPLVLLANDQEWFTRSLESVLWPSGYAILRAFTARKALERLASAAPDLILIDANLPDCDSAALCLKIREGQLVPDSTPILLTTPTVPSRNQRLAALRAGAWDVVSYPFDAEELTLRLDRYVRAKFDADRIGDALLVDETTGLYNVRGLERRVREIGAQAFRHGSSLACFVISPGVDEEDAGANAHAISLISTSLKEVLRLSDAIAHLGHGEFAVVAQGTDASGSTRLVERLHEAFNQSDEARHLSIRVGVEAIDNFHDSPLEMTELLARATATMDRSSGFSRN